MIKFGVDKSEEKFDAVVLATHSDQALKLLQHPTEKEKKFLVSPLSAQ